MKKIIFCVLLAFPGFINAQNAKIKIDVERTIGEIDPKIYGVFMEPIQISGRRGLPEPDYDMRNYNVQRMVDETRMTKVFLQALDGKTKRTFAFTCGDMKIGDSSFINAMKKDFVAARAVRSEMHQINQIDLYNVDCYMVNNNTAEEMIAWAKKAMETNSLLVILFHGVGGGNGLDVSLPNHWQFLAYLKQHQKDIWIPTMLEAAE